MADSRGSAFLRVTPRDEDPLLTPSPGDDAGAEDYLTELKRFAAALNGLPLAEIDAERDAPDSGIAKRDAVPLAAVASDSAQKPAAIDLQPVAAPAEPPLSAVPTAPDPDDLPDLSFDEKDDEAWWRELDARLARAPRRPLFAARREPIEAPTVTHTAPPSVILEPPPQLRRQIDPDAEAAATQAGGRWSGWDRLDTFFSAAGLLIVLLGAISSSTPRFSVLETSATIDLPVSRAAAEAATPPPFEPRIDLQLPPAAPTPQPFPVTLSLMSQSSDGPYLRLATERAFGPVALVNGATPPRGAAPVPVATTNLIDAEKTLDFVPVVAPEPATLGGAFGSEPGPIEAQMVTAPIRAAAVDASVDPPPAAIEVAVKPESPAVPDSKPADGGWLVHLASVRDERGAEPEWIRLKTQYGSLVPLTLTVRLTDLGAKGEWFRIYAGPFDTRAEAARLCAQLSGQYCQPMSDKRG